MCGISGIVSSSYDLDSRIRKMVSAQKHRGPDASDVFISNCGRCALGHNRLSIIDLSDHAKQPMLDHTGRYALVFNGEIYNYRELRSELSDYPYRTNSDTEVILAAWHKWGKDSPKHFIGMFAVAIWDNSEKKLTAFRDRLGIKPFHYYHDGKDFIFASEVKAILASGVKATPDMETWGEFLNKGLYDHTSSTFFKDIKSLDPGHILEVADNCISLSAYWSLSDYLEQSFCGTFEDAQEKYLELLSDSVRLRLRSDVPLGVNLSGGLDSSSMLAVVDRMAQGDEPLKAFTVSFKNTEYDEEDFAGAVPVQKRWNRIYARMDSGDLWNEIDHLMYHEEAPFGGIGTLSYFKLFEEIDKNKVTVVLEGQGVDECLGGYKYYQGESGKSATGVYQDGSSFLMKECLSDEIRKVSPLEYMSQPKSGSELNHRLYTDVRYNKLPRVLRMNDRLSMAFGKELREPFLDHRLVEFCFSLPDHFKIRNGQGKYLLRKVMQRYLPQSILETPKRAVVTPQREWMRTIFKQDIHDLLSSENFRSMGLFDVDESRKAFDEYCAGKGENGFFIWQWINASAWSRVFKVHF